MAEFIEVHQGCNPRFINLAWVEEIRPNGAQACIYFAFSVPNEPDQDFMEVDESYDTLVKKVMEVK